MKKKSEQPSTDRESMREFMRLLGRHERSLGAYILAQVHNWSDADEIAQETRLRLWEQFHRFERGSHFDAWARKIAYYQILTYRRQQQRESIRFSDNTVELLSVEADMRAHELSPRHLALERCLAKLSDSHRELIVRCYSQNEHSIRQVAQQLGRSYDATRKSLYRIRSILAECVDRALKPEGQS